MVDHRAIDIMKIPDYLDELVKIDDVYMPRELRGVFHPDVPSVISDKICENQMEFLMDVEHYEKGWKKGETRYEWEQRLIREFVEVHPELECLVPKTGKTVEEAQNSMKKKYPEDIPYDFTPR